VIRRWIGVFTLVSTIALSARADDEQAKVRFRAGVELMKKEAWDAALAEFRASLALQPTRNGYKNAAGCLRQLGRFDEAIEAYQGLLDQFGEQLPPAEVDELQGNIRELRKLTGQVTVDSNAIGATVVVDGRERGKTPLKTPIVVSQGTRVVRVMKSGYLPFEKQVNVLGQENVTVDAKLETLARSGRLHVGEDGGQALDVLVDGLVVGKTPFDGVVAPGEHIVALSGPDRIGTQPVVVRVAVDATTNLELRAERLGADARIEPEPPGARVMLDGVPLGQGVWSGPVRAGTHKVDVSAEGYFGASRSFVAEGEGATRLHVALERDEASPVWAKGRRRRFSVAAFGGLALGPSLGGDYEGSCDGAADCNDRSRPIGFIAGARGGYELVPRLSVELGVGFASVAMSVSRRMALRGEPTVPVPADIRDEVKLSGPFATLGASFVFVRKPIVFSAAVSGGALLGRVRERRTGTVESDANPQEPLLPWNADPVTKLVPIIGAELRVAVPLSEVFQVGLAFGGLVGFAGDVRPTAAQLQAPANAQAKSNGAFIGFVPQRGTSESAVGTFLMANGTVFGRMSF
jgi:hypothetical protein